MACMDFNNFKRFILQFDQATAIEKDKDKDLRYNVWETTSEQVQQITSELSTKILPNEAQSLRILDKLKGSLKRIRDSSAKGGDIQKVFDHEYNVEMSIALHELMESVKGESDKARNLGLAITSISDTGVLPALPMSRVAASIGRKIAFQKGYRFKRAWDEDSAASIEALYYDAGKEALVQLQKQGYVKFHKAGKVATIMDYINKEDLEVDFPKNEVTRSDVMSVSLDEVSLGIEPNTEESGYFLRRTDAQLTNTDLGVVTEKLRVANMLLQPATTTMPDLKADPEADLAQWDDGVKHPDPKTAKAREMLYKNPLYVHKALHGLMQMFNEDGKATGESASKRVLKVFGPRKNMVRSLFGLKRSDDFSIDKKESVGGQNLSKTTPLDDIAEYYDLMQQDGDPSPLHMKMKIGRNARLYYLNSVLNAHGSKQSRHMLTPGSYTVDVGTLDFGYLAFQIKENLNLEDSYDEIVSGTSLDSALELYDIYANSPDLRGKLNALGRLAKKFNGVDYVTILTSLQAVKDIRNPVGGKVTTEFPAASDATAQGGTLTFMQAIGTNPKIVTFLQRIGLLNQRDDDLAQTGMKDMYGLMTEAVNNFLEDKPGSGMGPDIGESDVKDLLGSTIDMLFLKQGKDVREFSKDPTMAFVYGQGRKGAQETLSRSLADRIIDSLDNEKTREYLTKLFDDEQYNKLEGQVLRDEKGLYDSIVERLGKTGLPGTIYDIMNDSIKIEFLEEYTKRSEDVHALVKLLPSDVPFKILPAGAVLSGKKASTPGDLKTYGMPITKQVEVLNTFEGKPDTVLTRKEKLHKPVMDVSPIHGTDSALVYHSIADVNPKDGVVVIHDEVRGSVPTVRAIDVKYVETAKSMASDYDIHQQIMESIAAQSPEIAASAEFKSLKAKIDEDVAEKKR
ncbi:MAG: hypothetical protein V3S69_03585, partial [Dehalococcoidales bacterium]